MTTVIKSTINYTEQIFIALAKYPLILMGLSAAMAVVVYQLALDAIRLIIIVMCLILVSILYSVKFSKLLAAMIVILVVIFRLTALEDRSILIRELIGEKAIIQFEVFSHPNLKDTSAEYVLKPKIISLENKEVALNNVLIKAKFSRYFILEKNYLYTLNCSLKEPENFGEFDYKGYLDAQGIKALAECSPYILHKEYLGNTFSQVLLDLRLLLIETSRKTLPEPHAGLLIGMLIGSKENFSEEFTDALSTSGTTHVIAVSGFNVNVISNILLGLAGFLPRKFVILLIMLVLMCFMFVVGWENIPAMRATFMILSTLVARLSGRRSAVWSALGFSVLILVLINPFCIMLLSFQLSFAATLGLMILPDRLANVIKFKGHLVNEFTTTLSAILATFPISYLGFGLLNSWALLANILLAPLVPAIMFTGILHTLLYTILKIKVVAMPTWLLLELFIRGNYFFAKLPFAKIDLKGYETPMIFAYLILIIVIIKIKVNEHEN